MLSPGRRPAPFTRNLRIVDPTTISLFGDILKGAGRNPVNGKKKGGIKMHTMIDALDEVPCSVRFSSAAANDHTFLNGPMTTSIPSQGRREMRSIKVSQGSTWATTGDAVEVQIWFRS